MKRILIPTDFSENSWAAIQCALCIFVNRNVAFTLLHIEDDVSSRDEDLIQKEQLTIHKNISTHNQLKKLALKMKSHASKEHQISFELRSGHFIKELRLAVHDFRIDLIVMSTKGKNIFDPKAFGSLTRATITQVKCTTLVVPQEIPCFPPAQVALLTDYNFFYKCQVLDSLQNIMKINEAHLSVIHLSRDRSLSHLQEENKQFLKDALTQMKHSFHFMINQTLEEALQFFIEVHKVDMIALLAKNLNFSQNLFFGTQDDGTKSYHAKTPFLILHES